MTIRKKITTIIFVAFFGLTMLPTLSANAQYSQEEDLLGLGYGQATGLGSEDLRFTVARIINVALSLLGIIAVVLVVYAGFMWMTAAGNDEKVGKAKKILIGAVIGLAIILSAYAITNFVVKELFQATTGYEYRTF